MNMSVPSNDSVLDNLEPSAKLTTLPSHLGTLAIFSVGILTIFVAVGFNTIRRHIHKDEDNLDLAFDAGGKVSTGLTATTIVSQWTWTATLLQSAAVASKYGISGPFWYAAGATVQILLFSVLSVKLKIKAPGAKTFLQVIKCRFGIKTHKVYCMYALLTNAIVTAMLMLGGAEVISSLIDDYSIEMATIMCTAIICGYTMIGGLGATFYASYFNTAFIFVGMYIFCYHVYFSHETKAPLGSIDTVYSLLQQFPGPEGNQKGSYITMLSKQGLMFGIINIIGNFGTVFVDQAYWQSSVAAKPKDGVLGFLAGGLVWFSVPFTFATTMGLAYLALSSKDGAPLLCEEEVNAGLVPVAVASRIGGYSTIFVLLIMILMAVTSTGSAEIVAVSSILVYDIYMGYLKPFRLTHDENTCWLCGNAQGRKATTRDRCKCVSIGVCNDCKMDDMLRKPIKRALKPDYTCKTHGQLRKYQDVLSPKKSWCLLWTSLATLPLTIFLEQINITLGWVYLFMGVLIGSAVIPVALALFWDRLTSNGMIYGPISGTLLGLTSWIITASTYEGCLRNFFTNTGQELSMLVGNVVSLTTGGLITFIISFWETRNMDILEKEEIWATTLDIDNPLYPWTELYKKELNLKEASKLDSRPPLVEIEKSFLSAQQFAISGSLLLTFVFIVLWPALACLLGVFSLTSFYLWVILSAVWGLIAGIFIIITPIWSEIKSSVEAYKESRSVHPLSPYPEDKSPNIEDLGHIDKITHQGGLTLMDFCESTA